MHIVGQISEVQSGHAVVVGIVGTCVNGGPGCCGASTLGPIPGSDPAQLSSILASQRPIQRVVKLLLAGQDFLEGAFDAPGPRLGGLGLFDSAHVLFAIGVGQFFEAFEGVGLA